MTSKELMQILKRFPKTAVVTFNGEVNYSFLAGLNSDGEWELKFTNTTENKDENSEQIVCNNDRNEL